MQGSVIRQSHHAGTFRPLCISVHTAKFEPAAVQSSGFARLEGESVKTLLDRLIRDESGQDIAEYAIMLAVILIIVVGTVKLIGGNANNTFSSVASTLGQ